MSQPNEIFNIAIATIFAREVLEGAIIIGNYRTAIIKSDKWKSEEQRQAALAAVTKWAWIAAIAAVAVVIAVAIPLGILSQELDDRVVEIIEGVSKVVAAVCILQLSLKIPVWLDLYEKVPLMPCRKKVPSYANHSLDSDDKAPVSLKEIRFNVTWNLWREIAECGVFLIPFFLGTGAKAIPLSALVGIVISLIVGGLLYIANQRMESKFWLAFFMCTITGFLSVGLFVGGCHEFEEVFGETPDVYEIENPNMSSKTLPMVLLKPFGYSSSRTVLQITTFWCWLLLNIVLHMLKYRATKALRAERAVHEQAGVKDIEKGADATGVDVEESSQEKLSEENDLAA